MSPLRLHACLLAGLGLVEAANVPFGYAQSSGVPIRTANSRLTQRDVDVAPSPPPIHLSPTPLPDSATPGAPPVGGAPIPPPPVPDVGPDPANSGGAVYRGPLGSDYQRPPAPKKQYLGDPNGPGSMTAPQAPGALVPIPAGPAGTPEASGFPLGGTDRYGVAPPPGTLGYTYRRRSRPIDDDKHPRVGVVEVHLSENYDVSAKGLKSKWTGKVWRLESDPLLPGLANIYQVKAEWGPDDAKQHQVRTVRLIIGRVVDLEF